MGCKAFKKRQKKSYILKIIFSKSYKINFMKVFISISLILFFLSPLQKGMAQQLSGFSQGKGKLAVAISTTREKYNEFYFGDKKTPLSATNLDKIVTQSINFYTAYGLTNKTDLIVNIPYIITKGHQLTDNKEVSEKNFQNVTLGIQSKLYQKENSSGAFSVTGGLSLSTPMTNYLTNVIYAIGNHSTQITPSALMQYKFSNGLFVNGQGGYSVRTNKVPEAFVSAAKIGYAGKIYVEAYISNQTSTGGIDIGAPGFTPERFPETKVNTTNIGPSVYVAGLTLGAGKRLSGRNAGLPSYYTVGLAYTFTLVK
jgi:hypothetical protein